MERIGDFRIEGVLLEGARGSLWRAWEDPAGRALALHLLDPSAAADAGALPPRGAGLAEQVAAGLLGDGLPWYATEWFDGGLDEVIGALDAPLPVADATDLLDALLSALAAAHAAGRTHLGLRPACVRLDAAGALHLLGFGLGPARAPQGTIDHACTAPELLAASDSGDARSDLYAVAVLAYRLFAGTLPRPAAPDPEALVESVLKGTPVPPSWLSPSSVNRALPSRLAVWVLRGLAFEPAARFDDAQAMRAALGDAAGGDALGAREEPTTAPPRLRTIVETLRAGRSTTAVSAANLPMRAGEIAGDEEDEAAQQARRVLREAAAAAGLDAAELEALLPARPRRPSATPSESAAAPETEDAEAEAAIAATEPAPETPAPPGRWGWRVATRLIAGLLALLLLLVAVVLLRPSNAPTGKLREESASAAGSAETVVVQRTPGERFRDALASGGRGPELVVVPAGSYRMGCVSGLRCAPDELPVHEVRIARPFAVGVYEVTFEEYDRFVAGTGGARPGDERWGRGRHPAINVSWDEARAYVAWLSEQTGARYRLPSEAQWEYFARAGSETPWFFGADPAQSCRHGNGADALTSYERRNAACNDGVGRRTAEVGSYLPNDFGLHDTLGNLWEWVEDCYVGSHEGAPADGSARVKEGACPTRLLRGGGLNSGPDDLRSANRERNSPTLSLYYIGFRVVREL